MYRLFPLILLLLVLTECRFPKFEKPNEDISDVPQYGVVFYEIDNEATIWVNDQEVFQNESNLSSTDNKIIVDLQEHLRRGVNKLDIKLKDIPNDRCLVNTWSISYDIYEKGKIMDYWQEKNPNNDECKEEYKVEKTYELRY